MRQSQRCWPFTTSYANEAAQSAAAVNALAEVLILVIGAVALLALLPPLPRPHRVRRQRTSPAGPSDLVRIEAIVGAGRRTAGDVHVRLRPLLGEVAGAALRRHGIHPEFEPARARTLLGEELWELIRPDRPRPEDRRAAGIGLRELERLTERLERL